MIPTHKDHRISVIYRITNKINGRFYVGSSISLYTRYQNYKSCARAEKADNVLIQRAMRKHGFNNFTFDILEEVVPDKSTLLSREQYWIDKLKPFYPVGYNVAPLSSSCLGVKRPTLCKKVLQINKDTLDVVAEFESIGEAAEAIGSSISSISAVCKGRKTSSKGYYWQYADGYDGKFCPKQRRPSDKLDVGIPIIQMDVDGQFIREWSCAATAAKALDCSAQNITHCCRGKMFSLLNFCWTYKDSYQQRGFTPNKTKIREKPIYQKDLNGVVIQKWESAKKASIALGMNASAIGNCCMGRYKTSSGFQWSYVN